MEISSSNPLERESNESCSCSNANSGPPLHLIPTPILSPTPKPTSNQTTFVQADTTTFKHVVQILTGSSTARCSGGGGIPPIKSAGQKKQGFKLYERRNSLKNGLAINSLRPGFSRSPSFSPRRPEILSPSVLDFPALALSPRTPGNEDGTLGRVSAEEDRAIAEKKFYFHPSPARGGEPRLLALFPVTLPRVSGSS